MPTHAASATPPVVHLRVHSQYAVGEGMLPADRIAQLARERGIAAVASADPNLMGALDLAVSLAKHGVQPITGTTIPLATPHATITAGVLARTTAGYQRLLTLSTDALCTGAPVALSALRGPDLAVLLHPEHAATASAVADGLGDTLAAVLIPATNSTIATERTLAANAIRAAEAAGLPVAAADAISFADAAHTGTHLILRRAHAEGATQPEPLPPGRGWFADANHFRTRYADCPLALSNAAAIAQACAFMPTKGKPRLPTWPPRSRPDAPTDLRALATEGLRRLTLERGLPIGAYMARLDEELAVITTCGFEAYFIIVADFIAWAKRHDIPVGPGRGSGAGSLVAWALGITSPQLDPIALDLLFERFLNPERVSMPDFDVDFCRDRREDVVRYVETLHGADRVAPIGTQTAYHAKAALREVGRGIGLPLRHVNAIAAATPDGVPFAKAVADTPDLQRLVNATGRADELTQHITLLEDCLSTTSTHAAGVVIADRPVTDVCPLMPGRDRQRVTQFSMYDAEAAGAVKYDFLGLKTLTLLKIACDHLARAGRPIDLDCLPLNDAATYALLQSKRTRGVFQLESHGMRDTLAELKPTTFENIIALVALYRPGPMDEIPRYIRRRHGQEPIPSVHPDFDRITAPTFGILIYQEQVIECARVLAGYSRGKADILRRAMGKKIPEEMAAMRTDFVAGCRANGISSERATAFFDLILKFAGYGFNRSHAAAYALNAYHTAFLKANEPAAFYAALATVDSADPDVLADHIRDARMAGIHVLAPDALHPAADFQPVNHSPDSPIRYGFMGIRGIGAAKAREIAAALAAAGPASLASEAEALRLLTAAAAVADRAVLTKLIDAGTFGAAPLSHRALLDVAAAAATRAKTASNQSDLFGTAPVQRAETAAAPAEPDDGIARMLASLGTVCPTPAVAAHLAATRPQHALTPSDLTNAGRSTTWHDRDIHGLVESITTRPATSGTFVRVVITDAVASMIVTATLPDSAPIPSVGDTVLARLASSEAFTAAHEPVRALTIKPATDIAGASQRLTIYLSEEVLRSPDPAGVAATLAPLWARHAPATGSPDGLPVHIRIRGTSHRVIPKGKLTPSPLLAADLDATAVVIGWTFD